MNETKEIDIFNRHSRFKKLTTVGIAIIIATVAIVSIYFLAKSLMTYTVSYELNGGYVYGSELKPSTYGFLSKVQEPKNVKKEGYYIEYWSKDEDLGSAFEFNKPIWNSMTLYVKWAPGVAIRLNFAPGEENTDLPLKDLKGYYEQYQKEGNDFTLPLIYNTNKDSLHYGEQLLWYMDENCTGNPFATKTWTNIMETIDIYGVWFDTEVSKFQVDTEGTLTKYLGHCNKIMLPNNIVKIKDTPVDEFNSGESDSLNDQSGVHQSVWQNVMDDSTGVNGLKIIYLNNNLREIGDGAFKDCEGLQEVIFTGSHIERIGKWAFGHCSKLFNITIPTTITTIEEYAFYEAFDSTKQVKLILPENITTIEEHAFANSGLYEIELNGVEFIGKKAFAACLALTKFNVKSSNVITSDVTILTGENNEGIFLDTYTEVSYAKHLKIYIPASVVSEYLALNYWNVYSEDIVAYA